jgi:hypothetical protein
LWKNPAFKVKIPAFGHKTGAKYSAEQVHLNRLKILDFSLSQYYICIRQSERKKSRVKGRQQKQLLAITLLTRPKPDTNSEKAW